MSFLQEPYSEYNKVEKLVLVTTSSNGLDEEEELKTDPIFNYNDYNVVSDSKSESDHNSENDDFDKDIENENEGTLKTTLKAKVDHVIKKL